VSKVPAIQGAGPATRAGDKATGRPEGKGAQKAALVHAMERSRLKWERNQKGKKREQKKAQMPETEQTSRAPRARGSGNRTPDPEAQKQLGCRKKNRVSGQRAKKKGGTRKKQPWALKLDPTRERNKKEGKEREGQGSLHRLGSIADNGRDRQKDPATCKKRTPAGGLRRGRKKSTGATDAARGSGTEEKGRGGSLKRL